MDGGGEPVPDDLAGEGAHLRGGVGVALDRDAGVGSGE